jgi:hypothetical protein
MNVIVIVTETITAINIYLLLPSAIVVIAIIKSKLFELLIALIDNFEIMVDCLRPYYKCFLHPKHF